MAMHLARHDQISGSQLVGRDPPGHLPLKKKTTN